MTELYIHRQEQAQEEVAKVERLVSEFFSKRGAIPINLNWPSHRSSGEEHGTYALKIRSPAIRTERTQAPFIVLNSHGRFHGRTYFSVRQFKGRLGYVHIDAHADGCTENFKEVDCGNFVNNILRLPNISDVCLIGPTYYPLRECLGWYDGDGDNFGSFNFSPTSILTDERTRFFLGDGARTSTVRKDRFDDPEHLEDLKEWIESFNHKYIHLGNFDPSLIKANNVYISVDLDVVKGFPSGWPNAGILSIKNVLDAIQLIGREKRIIGADICGLALESSQRGKYAKEDLESGLKTMFEVYSTLREGMFGSTRN